MSIWYDERKRREVGSSPSRRVLYCIMYYFTVPHWIMKAWRLSWCKAAYLGENVANHPTTLWFSSLWCSFWDMGLPSLRRLTDAQAIELTHSLTHPRFSTYLNRVTPVSEAIRYIPDAHFCPWHHLGLSPIYVRVGWIGRSDKKND